MKRVVRPLLSIATIVNAMIENDRKSQILVRKQDGESAKAKYLWYRYGDRNVIYIRLKWNPRRKKSGNKQTYKKVR